jgi:hypothetical protein
MIERKKFREFLFQNNFEELTIPGGFIIFRKGEITVHEPIVGNWSYTEEYRINKVINSIDEFKSKLREEKLKKFFNEIN